ncbi:MAG: adenylate/guanylate cyclase domain-containing protein [Proteobacteria bacterium]|nr:adenylate/guanylate cyclase domain-containing protein [Pseudomonadota bacterium]
MDLPATHYAKSGDVCVAYQIFGGGPIDLVFVPGWISHLDLWWDSPVTAGWLERFGRFARVIMFDKRGTGLSDRDCGLPGVDQRMDDIRAVMDAAGSNRAAILGISEGGSLAALFAASHPDRCQALVLHGAFAKFTSWFPTQDELDAFFDYVREKWGSGDNMALFSQSRKEDQAYRMWWGRRERAAASPSTAIALMKMNSEIDISGILPAVRVPTLVIHRSNDTVVDIDGGRQLATLIPHAQFLESPGKDHTPWTGDDVDALAERIEEFLTGSKPAERSDRVLTTVLFTDIVESTARAEALGDRRWRDLLEAHNKVVRAELERFRGSEVRFTGDGFLTTFDGPARAIRCGLAIAEGVRPLGIDVRIGLHTGEVNFSGGDVHGIAVHIAARVAALSGAGETLVSRTVKDLVAGSGISFKDFGIHALKGIPEEWQLFRAIG